MGAAENKQVITNMFAELARGNGAAFLDTIANARAFIFAGCEDFGIVLAEAQACGTPLVALDRGGVSDIVRSTDDGDAPTGLLFGRQSVEAIIDAVDAFEVEIDEIAPAACRENAMRFSEARFHREFADAWGRAVDANRQGFIIRRDSSGPRMTGRLP